uniref:GTP-binding protein n=1 Tax=Caenorhabditis tropicalis TaxID=1561998 RepID=A0A1I7T0B7_9PELO
MKVGMYGNRSAAKILVLGPPKAGKTTFCRFLADFMEESLGLKRNEEERERKFEFEFSTTYIPTKAARIQEFETLEFFSGAEHAARRLQDSEVHLWDVSGDRKYEDCWPAIKENAEGVILVANPEEHKGKDLKLWYTEFVEKENINLNCVMVILNEQGSKKTNHEQISSFEILPQLRTVHHVAHHFGSEALQIKAEFNTFMASVLKMEEPYNEMAENHGLSYEETPEEEDF